MPNHFGIQKHVGLFFEVDGVGNDGGSGAALEVFRDTLATDLEVYAGGQVSCGATVCAVVSCR